MAYAIITGASGGIGLCLADELAARKYDLLLIARTASKLQEACHTLQAKYGIAASYLALDLSEPTAADAIVRHVIDQNLPVKVLVNNAGYGIHGAVGNVALSDLENMIALNIGALTALCHKMIPILTSSKPAFLMNVASTAAYQAVPTLSTYAATKAYVVLFTRGLRYELRKQGISVSCLSPGATSTGFVSRAGLDFMNERAEKFSMKPEPVAKIAIHQMLKGKAEIIPGFMNWISVKATYFLPKGLIEKIAAGLYE